MQLKDKVVIVTGGSDGIGRHICLKLAAAGCQVALLGRNAERLAAVETETAQSGAAKAKGYACDFADPTQIDATAAQIIADFGRIDILVNNAGIWHKTSPLDEIDAGALMATVQTNLTGTMQLTRACLPALRKADEGAILNVISKSGVVSQDGQSVYTATKYGMRGFTEVLKSEEAVYGVRVAGLYQSGTNTSMFAKANEEVPNHIFTEPDDLADVVVFMLSRPPKLWIHDIRIEL